MTASIRADSRFFRLSFERRARWAVMAFLIVALVVLLSALSQRRERPWIHIGTVVGFEPGEWLYLDSMDRPFALLESTSTTTARLPSPLACVCRCGAGASATAGSLLRGCGCFPTVPPR